MLSLHACTNCGFWQRWPGVPATCPVCSDYRNALPDDGFAFADPGEVAARVRCSWREVDDGVVEFSCAPRFGLDSRGWLLRSPEGNVAFEAAPLYSDDALDAIDALGGIRWLSSSHPHGYGALWQLQDRFGPELAIHRGDLSWTKALRVTWPFDDTLDLGAGRTLVHSGGHFDGHVLLHDGPRRTLYAGDAMKFDTDAAGRAVQASAHKAFHTRLPLTADELRRYREVIAPLDFTTVCSPFGRAEGASTADAVALIDELLAGRPDAAPRAVGR